MNLTCDLKPWRVNDNLFSLLSRLMSYNKNPQPNIKETISFFSSNMGNVKIQSVSLQHKHEKKTKQNKNEIKRQLVTGISQSNTNKKAKTHKHRHTHTSKLVFRKTLTSGFFYEDNNMGLVRGQILSTQIGLKFQGMIELLYNGHL